MLDVVTLIIHNMGAVGEWQRLFLFTVETGSKSSSLRLLWLPVGVVPFRSILTTSTLVYTLLLSVFSLSPMMALSLNHDSCTVLTCNQNVFQLN